jgi:DNA-3-methyladenine glycosylase II
MPLSMIKGRLEARSPFDFAQSLAFLRMFSPMHGEQLLEPGGFTKALRLDGRVVVFRVTEAAHGVQYELSSSAPLEPEQVRRVERRIADFLSLEDPVEEFYAKASGDPAIASRIVKLHGLHQVRFLTAIEIAVWAVLTQRNPIPLAKKTKLALCERWGGSLVVDGVRHLAFPEARDLAEADPEELAAIVQNERRTRYVLAVARAFVEQSDDFLRTAPPAEVDAWLKSIDGIGGWSSAFVLFRGLGRIRDLPLTPPIQASVRKTYGRRIGVREMRELADLYGPWKGYWALYLRA